MAMLMRQRSANGTSGRPLPSRSASQSMAVDRKARGIYAVSSRRARARISGGARCSQADLAAPPVAAELVVPDLGVALHAEPLGQRAILVDLLGQVLLRLESLARAHGCLPSAFCT